MLDALGPRMVKHAVLHLLAFMSTYIFQGYGITPTEVSSLSPVTNYQELITMAQYTTKDEVLKLGETE